jgi:hypothetical protein
MTGGGGGGGEEPRWQGFTRDTRERGREIEREREVVEPEGRGSG